MQGTITKHYEKGGFDVVEVDIGGGVIQATQRLGTDGPWGEMHQALQVGQAVVVQKNRSGYWGVNFKETNALASAPPQPSQSTPEVPATAWEGVSQQDYINAAKAILRGLKPELAKMETVPDAFWAYCSTVFIAISKNPTALKSDYDFPSDDTLPF